MSESTAQGSSLAGSRWLRTSPDLRKALEHWEANAWPAEQLLTEGMRRRLTIVESGTALPAGGKLLLKRFRGLPHRRKSARLKRWLGRSSAEREFEALTQLAHRRLPIPEALGLARLENAEWLLVLRYLEGRPLEEAIASAAGEAPALLESLGAALADLHRARVSHGDLHIGNVLISEKGPAFLDFQTAGRASSRAVFRDIGSMDFSLALHGATDEARERFRRAALRGREASQPRVERAAQRHRSRYYRSRTRRCTQPGRQYARVQVGAWTGMRVVDLPAQTLQAALAAHSEALSRGGPSVLKCDHRSRVSAVATARHPLIAKEVTKGGLARRLADTVRGSPARRAWIGGHGLRIRGIDVARPLAFLELRSGWGPRASLLLMEDLRPAQPAGALLGAGNAEDRSAALDALCALTIRLHEARVVHGDLQAHHVYLSRSEDGIRAALIDLEGVRFRWRLRDAERVDALAELNASLADELVSGSERRQAFARYAHALPFRLGAARSLLRVVNQSRARGHFWRGDDCDPLQPIRLAEP